MKKLYLVTTTMWNGTVPMGSFSCAVTTNEIAEKAKKAVDEANKSATMDSSTEVQEITLYESEEEVPILNKNEEHPE